MSNRRMFSKKIITSAKFLKMPLSTQALYFHLGLNADDDGVVEAFPIIRVVGSSDDDFKILLAKQFIIQLNDEQVCFITDWLEHNTIRADRKVDSIYKGLLIQTIDNVKLIESKPRSDRQPKDSDGTVPCQSGDGISKDKLSKVKISKDKKTINASSDACLCVDYFNEVNNTKTKGAKPVIDGLTKILKDYTIDDVKKVIDYMANSWYSENGQNTLSVLAKYTKFHEKLEKAEVAISSSKMLARIESDGIVFAWLEGTWMRIQGTTPEWAYENWNVVEDERETKQ